MFKDRSDAGRRLAQKLGHYRNQDALVLALPRGGVAVAREIATVLSLPLDILSVRKIGHPDNPEYAIGAVDSSGAVLFNRKAMIGIDKMWIKEQKEREEVEARRRGVLYRAGEEPKDLRDRVVIIVDDGIATGISMQLALRVVRSREPKRIVIAVPIASSGSLITLRRRGANEVIVLQPPEAFRGAVAEHYKHFPQVDDEEVIRLLRQ